MTPGAALPASPAVPYPPKSMRHPVWQQKALCHFVSFVNYSSLRFLVPLCIGRLISLQKGRSHLMIIPELLTYD